MDQFELVVTLLSFVYALALTHILQYATDLMLARERVRFSLVHALWILLAIQLLCANWLTLWAMREAPMSMALLMQSFVFAILQYFFAALLSPRVPDEGPADMVAHHQRHGRLYALMGAAVTASAIVNNVTQHGVYQMTLGQALLAQIANLVFVGLLLVAAWRRERWVQYACVGLLVVVMTLSLMA